MITMRNGGRACDAPTGMLGVQCSHLLLQKKTCNQELNSVLYSSTKSKLFLIYSREELYSGTCGNFDGYGKLWSFNDLPYSRSTLI